MIRARALFLAAVSLPAWAGEIQLRPPLRVDPDNQPIPRPEKQSVSEMNAILYNSWLRHLDGSYRAACALDGGALSVNAWDEAPDSSWFTNRIGLEPLLFEEIVRGLGAKPPAPPPWTVWKIIDEGYTPKVFIRDSAQAVYIVKFDPNIPERNSAAERISTLIFHAAGFNVPGNVITHFRAEDLILDPKATISDGVNKPRPMTQADLLAEMKKASPRPDGRYRALASSEIKGEGVGKFKYSGTRKDDANDIIPHELRRELRGMYVIASWVNHCDCGDKNTFDAYQGDEEKKGSGFLRHYLIDFGSTLGAGDFTNGPYRMGNEYLFDGASMGRTLASFGFWRRPWEVRGRIQHPEVGYFQTEMFAPDNWKPNYPNLAFVRRDDADAYWGAKIVTAFGDELIRQLAESGQYSRAEASAYVAETLKGRRDAIGSYWLDRVSPLEDFVLKGDVLTFHDIGVERGYANENLRAYRILAGSGTAPVEFRGRSAPLPNLRLPERARADRFGRTPLAAVRIQSKNRAGGWALPVEVILGRNADSPELQVLGWRHAAR